MRVLSTVKSIISVLSNGDIFVRRDVCNARQEANEADRKRIEDCVETEVKALKTVVKSMHQEMIRGFSCIEKKLDRE